MYLGDSVDISGGLLDACGDEQVFGEEETVHWLCLRPGLSLLGACQDTFVHQRGRVNGG